MSGVFVHDLSWPMKGLKPSAKLPGACASRRIKKEQNSRWDGQMIAAFLSSWKRSFLSLSAAKKNSGNRPPAINLGKMRRTDAIYLSICRSNFRNRTAAAAFRERGAIHSPFFILCLVPSPRQSSSLRHKVWSVLDSAPNVLRED